MFNVEYRIEKRENKIAGTESSKLIIEIDLDERGGLSASGKSVIVASTGGNVPIEGTSVVLGLNAYVKAPR